MMKFFWTLMLLFSFAAQAQKLKAGPWRFEMKTPYTVIPFVIDFKWQGNKLTGTLLNGKETISLKNITVKKDQISIPLQTYELSLELTMEKDDPKSLTGLLIRHNKNPVVKNQVFGKFGEKERFPGERAPAKIDLNGRWALVLTDEDGKDSVGVAIFEQKESRLHGTVMTPTGDYRYFDGYVSGDDFEAASFDGMFNYNIRGSVKEGRLEGMLAANYHTRIQGVPKKDAALPDAYNQTQVTGFNFIYPDLKGKLVAVSDRKFKGKPLVVQIFGSWCPNCMDEMNFLIPWYKANHHRGVEIIGLAFERSLDEKSAKIQLLKTQKAKNIPYTVLLAGSTSEDKPAEKLVGLKNFISFPTTVFLDKKHQVVKVHAGFTGPSTGEFYEKWKQDFNSTVDGLLK